MPEKSGCETLRLVFVVEQAESAMTATLARAIKRSRRKVVECKVGSTAKLVG